VSPSEDRTDKEAVTQDPKGTEVARGEATSEEDPKEPNDADLKLMHSRPFQSALSCVSCGDAWLVHSTADKRSVILLAMYSSDNKQINNQPSKACYCSPIGDGLELRGLISNGWSLQNVRHNYSRDLL